MLASFPKQENKVLPLLSPQIRAICEGGAGTLFGLMFSVGKPTFHSTTKT